MQYQNITKEAGSILSFTAKTGESKLDTFLEQKQCDPSIAAFVIHLAEGNPPLEIRNITADGNSMSEDTESRSLDNIRIAIALEEVLEGGIDPRERLGIFTSLCGDYGQVMERYCYESERRTNLIVALLKRLGKNNPEFGYVRITDLKVEKIMK